jgi:hypothetical protein
MPLLLIALALGGILLWERSRANVAPSSSGQGTITNPYTLALDGTSQSVALKAGNFYSIPQTLDANGEGWLFLPLDPAIVTFVASPDPKTLLISALKPGSTIVSILGQNSPNHNVTFNVS